MISDEIGKKHGKLLVLEEVPSDVKGHRKYNCLCDCGNQHVCTRNNLLRGITTQCTLCASQQRVQNSTTLNVKEHRKTYDSYRGMFHRSGKLENYEHVSICERWSDPVNGYPNFKEDMGWRPNGMTLDRINHRGNYEPSNCRWTTSSVQNHNKSKRCDAKTSDYIGVSACKDMWVAQLWVDGVHLHRDRFASEEAAAIHYDNISEDNYGDRPNGTTRKLIVPDERKVGGITFDNRYLSYRVRVTLPCGARKSFGNYKEELHAIFVLGNEITKYYY